MRPASSSQGIRKTTTIRNINPAPTLSPAHRAWSTEMSAASTSRVGYGAFAKHGNGEQGGGHRGEGRDGGQQVTGLAAGNSRDRVINLLAEFFEDDQQGDDDAR